MGITIDTLTAEQAKTLKGLTGEPYALSAGKLLQALECLVDLPGALAAAAARSLLPGLVLVLLRVEFQIE